MSKTTALEKQRERQRNITRIIARTAIFIALTVTMQLVTRPMSQFVTGSVVNLIRAVALMSTGLFSGVVVGIVSPFLAALLGIVPNWVFMPFIAVSNVAFVLVWYFISKLGKTEAQKTVSLFAAMAAAVLAKFTVLFIGVAQIAIPIILDLPEPQASRMTTMFTVNQLITASIGGVLAIIIFKVIKKAINGDK